MLITIRKSLTFIVKSVQIVSMIWRFKQDLRNTDSHYFRQKTPQKCQLFKVYYVTFNCFLRQVIQRLGIFLRLSEVNIDTGRVLLRKVITWSGFKFVFECSLMQLKWRRTFACLFLQWRKDFYLCLNWLDVVLLKFKYRINVSK